MAALQFELQHTDPNSKARAGTITTDHGEIATPIFMPVGTVGTVKAVTKHQLLQDVKAQIILGNTYQNIATISDINNPYDTSYYVAYNIPYGILQIKFKNGEMWELLSKK